MWWIALAVGWLAVLHTWLRTYKKLTDRNQALVLEVLELRNRRDYHIPFLQMQHNWVAAISLLAQVEELTPLEFEVYVTFAKDGTDRDMALGIAKGLGI